MNARRLAFVLLCLSGCAAPESKCGPATAEVQSVIDGDTLELSDGRRLRLLLVDTPETTQGKNDCYGQDAKAFTVAQVTGKTLSLTYDEASCTDRFGRTLAYVKVGQLDLNAELAKQGLACFLFVKPGGEARQDELQTYEAEARTNRTGMWGSCSVIPCSM